MNLSIGIVGLPNAGKSTLFNALLGRQIADVADYPFTTIEPNVGVVEVPDKRLARLAEIIGENRSWKMEARKETRSSKLGKSSVQHPASSQASSLQSPASVKIIPAAIKFIDIAGLVKDAHKGEGLGNQFLAKIREVDAILHVVRAFKNPNVAHPLGSIDPDRDTAIINEELRLAGIGKPVFVYYNREYPGQDVGGQAHAPEAAGNFGSGIDQIIKGCYKLLDLVTMFTVEGGQQISRKAPSGPRRKAAWRPRRFTRDAHRSKTRRARQERMAQAWPVKRGAIIKEAVGMIHSDFRDKFIRAEVVPFAKLDEAGSLQQARSRGWVRVEGKGYRVNDGDVVTVKI